MILSDVIENDPSQILKERTEVDWSLHQPAMRKHPYSRRTSAKDHGWGRERKRHWPYCRFDS